MIEQTYFDGIVNAFRDAASFGGNEAGPSIRRVDVGKETASLRVSALIPLSIGTKYVGNSKAISIVSSGRLIVADALMAIAYSSFPR